jgi:hypothetical protein
MIIHFLFIILPCKKLRFEREKISRSSREAHPELKDFPLPVNRKCLKYKRKGIEKSDSFILVLFAKRVIPHGRVRLIIYEQFNY